MLAEKIYELRRKNGLSQEQLADRLNVSRQAVSKWERGVSVPELDKIVRMSELFNVTTDYLTKEDACPAGAKSMEENQCKRGLRVKRLSIALLVVGAACLAVWGIAVFGVPAAADRFNESFAVTLNGSGFLLLMCAAFLIAGVILAFKAKHR